MIKKRYLIPIIGLYLTYFMALVFQNNVIGDIVSPILTFLTLAFVFLGFVWKEKHRRLKIAMLLLALSILTWAISDIMWGISTLVLHVNPENNIIITYGYSLTNLLLLISLLLSGYFYIKKWNKMQTLLDITMVFISIMVVTWVYAFAKDTNRAAVLLTEPDAMISLIISVVTYAWINVWFFSVRDRNSPMFVNFLASASIVFVATDFIYYYQYFYHSYEPNSLLDGGYVIAFTLMGIGGWVKFKGYKRKYRHDYRKGKRKHSRLKKELLFLSLPLFLIVFRGIQAPDLLFVVTAIMFYFLFTNFTQNSIHRDEILKKEREHVIELENRVEERTVEIIKIMSTDVVTGLKNRRHFEEYLEKLIRRIGHHEKIHLLYIDLNRYKSLKAIHGKYIAEKSLAAVGERIDRIVTKIGGLTASYGEDVFVAVFKSRGSYDEALSLAEKIINHCSDGYHIENHLISITLNIGISSYPLDAKNMEGLLKNADTAMMEARKTGFNIIRGYDHQIGAFLNQKDRIEMRLKKVQFDEEFSLQYQPQVSCADGSIYGVEALLRWYTKQGEYIPPMEFIPIAEETGMIIPLGYWIMDQAAKQLSKWRKGYNTNISMAINVSTKQLLEEDFTKRLKQTLEKYYIPPEFFEIEITENIQLENNTMIKDTLNELREMGVAIAIDDFGTGYSSLYYLKQLAANRIKIAKELIDNIETDIYSKSIVQMVISVGKVNNIKVIAEGVETKGQWECLQRLECDEIQGFLFSKPIKPVELENKWLTKKQIMEKMI